MASWKFLDEAAERAERAIAACWEIATTPHYLYNGLGDVIRHPATGEPVEDAGVKLEALTEARGWSMFLFQVRRVRGPAVTQEVVDEEIKRLQGELDKWGRDGDDDRG